MTDNPTLFERIKEFVLLGYDNNEIAETLNIYNKSKYIQRVRREVTRPTETPAKSPAIIPKKYYKLMKKNKGTKEELAAELGCSRMWLHKFERSTGANQKLAEYLYLRGMSIGQIATTLGAKKSTIKDMKLEALPTLDGIREQMKQALAILKKASIFDDEIEAQYYVLQREINRF